MAIDLRQLPAHIGATADFRVWGLGLAAQFAAIGLVKTADTGQIDWTTVVTPAGNSSAGYEIWQFNDSLQATKPVFIKVEYGMATTANSNWLRISVGTGTNGAGTLTGQLSSIRLLASQGAKAIGGTLPSYCSGNSSRLNLCTNLDPSSSIYTILVLIERTKNGAGVDTGDGIVAHSQNASGGQFQVIPYAGSIPTFNSQNNAMCTLNSTTGGLSTSGVDVALSPTVAFLGKCLFASWCAYTHADIGELTPFVMNHLGANHTYIPLGDTLISTYTNQLGGSGVSLAMLWE